MEPVDDGPYRALWSAVMIQAIRDLSGRSSTDRTIAQNYIFEERCSLPGSFDWICSMLGLEPNAIRTIVMTREGRARLQDRNRQRPRRKNTDYIERWKR